MGKALSNATATLIDRHALSLGMTALDAPDSRASRSGWHSELGSLHFVPKSKTEAIEQRDCNLSIA